MKHFAEEAEEEFLSPLCDNCGLRVVEPYIECFECEYVSLCAGCFSRGAEPKGHRSDHDYSVRRNDAPVFDSDWTAAEEYALLRAVGRNGYGDWAAVARGLPPRSAVECRRHFDLFHLDSLPFSSPPPFVRRDDPPFLYPETDREDPPRAPASETCRRLAGYNAFRSEFELNYDNNAERTLDFPAVDEDEDEDDDGLGESLRAGVALAYNARLRERRRRYEIIRRHGLLNVRRFDAWWRHRGPPGKEAGDALARVLQLLTAVRSDELVERLNREREKRLQLYALHDLRRNGVTTARGRRLYETLKARREEDAKNGRANDGPDWRRAGEAGPAPEGASAAPRPGAKKRTAPPMEIAGLADYEKLEDAHREFCSATRIAPSSFLRFRQLLMAENDKNAFVRLCDARKLIKIDVNKTRKLYDMLISEGLIKKQT